MKIDIRHPVFLAAAGFAATAALLGTTSAHAQVMQVADNGTVLTRSGAGLIDWNENTSSPSSLPVAALTTRLPAVPAAYADTVTRVSAAHGISPALLEALIWQESRWRVAAVSRVGARGLTQLMPATARSLGVDPGDPVAAIEGGARYLRQQLDRFDGDVERALAAYNAGPGRVIRAGGIPNIAETRAYVAAILARLSPKEK
ncbi:Transglycosylase SLT domain-containing protein [Sphingomonas gellani]|uniref:Transglycosylase SLT domain-containing protein n=1 Tax=Sphingomonas gellani TaxID=1166340 RepID=A0A1H8JCG4_9SPHN|nr:lytic transglycosylase domain-containing protein [Sphingomonas gellani]SEN77828.1 Transglycosylase SLT domain-containing protein [Sphingomonas gellani]